MFESMFICAMFIWSNPTPYGYFMVTIVNRWVKFDPHGIYWTTNAIDLKLCKLLDQNNKKTSDKNEKLTSFLLTSAFFDSSNVTLMEKWLFVISFNPFVSNALFLYPLKTSENHTVFWCFQGVEKGCIGNEWVNSVELFRN